jgi:hypothetical protein
MKSWIDLDLDVQITTTVTLIVRPFPLSQS